MRTTLGLLILRRKYMGELKQHQPSMSIDEQVENLKSLDVDQIEALIEKYEKIDVRTMGFTDNWKELLEIG
jgi:phosphoserine phosphatase